MALRDAHAEPTSDVSMASVGETHRHRYGRQALRQPSFDWKAPDKYVELLNFEIEVVNILQTRTYDE